MASEVPTDWTAMADEAKARVAARFDKMRDALRTLEAGRRRLGERSDMCWCAWCGGLCQTDGVEVCDVIGRFVGLVHYDGCLASMGLLAEFDNGGDGAAVWAPVRL